MTNNPRLPVLRYGLNVLEMQNVQTEPNCTSRWCEDYSPAQMYGPKWEGRGGGPKQIISRENDSFFIWLSAPVIRWYYDRMSNQLIQGTYTQSINHCFSGS